MKKYLWILALGVAAAGAAAAFVPRHAGEFTIVTPSQTRYIRTDLVSFWVVLIASAIISAVVRIKSRR
jgi:hypothetical protein